ncbi:MAG: hypothetical protein RIR83_1642 [Pseudomonadota bacterium]
MEQMKSEVRDGMQIEWDMPITMSDGTVLRADVFRPLGQEKYPVIITYGPYAKYLHFEQIYKTCWDKMIETFPEVGSGTSNEFQSWEVVDPEKWVPDNYVVIRVDSRGCGRSPGYVERQGWP